jgi:FMN-dependent NADH-azoreductase
MRERPLRLLHIEASPRGERSRSGAVVQRLIAGLGDVDLETLNVFAADFPAFNGAVIEGRYALIAGESVPLEMTARWAAIQQLVDHFLAFDGWIFSVPMWNFGIPYRLKHYIDLLTHPGMTFAVGSDGVVGLGADRTALLVGSGALDIRPGGPAAALDHQIAYLETWLGFIGVTDIHTIRLCPTYGSIEEVEIAMERAYAEADALAARLSRPARV